ncbi:hypothetical protein PInf_010959 [Phytophthora infestans]|nr:hypothetical protein PInf_010959 [Phytophthora infestans]
MEYSDHANLIETALEALKSQQFRLKVQRRRMVRWRHQRKEKLATIRDEIQRLENVLEQLLYKAQTTLHQLSPESTSAALYRVTIERAALHRDNLQLQDAITRHLEIETKLKRETDQFRRELHQVSKVKATSSQLALDSEGWWVHFPNGEPPFFFHPIPEDEYLDKLKQREVEFTERHLFISFIDNMFGWSVDYVPPFQQASGTTIAHARFSKRLRCSLPEACQTLERIDISQWPKIISPRSWGLEQRGDSYCQPLQKFVKQDGVVVWNIPGDVHLRYIAAVQNRVSVLPDGRQMAKHCIMIVDSEANAREAAGSQSDVKWVFQGGENCIWTEVDESTVDVVYDQWSECLSEAHGWELYVDWIRFVLCMEEHIAPTRLLQK